MSVPQALEGIRILVMEDFVVLPWASMLLGDMGAEVIRIEAPTRLVSRQFSPFPEGKAGPEWWNESGSFDLWYRNKKSLVLNIQSPEGKEIFHELVKISDVVASNFRSDVMERLGLSYGELRKLRPDLIMVNVTGFGQTGPWKNYGAFARTIDGFTGLSHLTGYVGGPPVRANATYMDMTGALNNAQAIMLAILQREQTGEGAHIDTGMYETGVNAIGPAVLKVQQNGEISPRRGNGHETMAPHGCYKCKGKDKWVNISVGTDEQWENLCKIMENCKLLKTPLFSDGLSRWHNQDKLNSIIEAWTLKHDNKVIAELLQKGKIPAGAVLNNQDVAESTHLKSRGFFEKIDRKYVGTHFYPGFVPRFSKNPGQVRKAAPCLGEDNYYIFGSLLGMTKIEIKELEDAGVIGTTALI